jgi:hypothetical protein
VNIGEADALLSTYLSTHWSETPLAWTNVEPRAWASPGQPLLPEGDDDYVVVDIDLIANRNITVPVGCIRSSGQIRLGVCTKQGGGTRVAKNRLSRLVELLENVTIKSTTGEVLRVRNLVTAAGYTAANGWYVEEAAFAFYYERHQPIS